MSNRFVAAVITTLLTVSACTVSDDISVDSAGVDDATDDAVDGATDDAANADAADDATSGSVADDDGAAPDSDGAAGGVSVESAADAGAFCEVLSELGGEQPESYVGSDEHVADTDRLLAVSPPSVSEDVSVFRDVLASGFIDSETDPASNETANWPDDVQAAVGDIRSFGAETC